MSETTGSHETAQVTIRYFDETSVTTHSLQQIMDHTHDELYN